MKETANEPHRESTYHHRCLLLANLERAYPEIEHDTAPSGSLAQLQRRSQCRPEPSRWQTCISAFLFPLSLRVALARLG